MREVLSLIRRFPLVATTIVIGILGLVLWSLGATAPIGWIFSIFALLVAARSFVNMLRELKSGSWGIDILAIMAIIATVLVGEYVASLLIVLMLTGGEALEDYAAGRAKRELNALLSRAPQIAHRIGSTETGPDETDVVDVPATQVRPGDTLLLRPAEIVPVDGVLLSPSAAFDESSLTGESIPAEHIAGDAVLSGSINGQAAVTMRATATAANSQYQHIIALVSEAAESRAPVVRLADRYAVPFTIVSLLIAATAWIATGDPVRFAEVLVVATPCPLLIAAPVAFMGGMSRSARNGIIVKGGGVLEQLSRAKTVVFDKTGTLTYGQPAINRINPAGAFAARPGSENELLKLAASAEQYSSHVLAASIIAEARARGIQLEAADAASEVATNGVVATINGQEVAIGKFAFIAERTSDAVATELHSGELAIYIAVGDAFAGSIVASDRVRDNARATIESLAAHGVRESMMLTGDARVTAEYIANEVGIDQVQAECLPRDKVDTVRALTNRPVIMVGDGVNDAPVLAVADVGIAMGAKGSTAASESADVVIMLDDISRADRAVIIGQDTVRIALQSIWLGIAISIGLMILAAYGWIPATIGALLQELVDLATILNSLRAIGARRDAAGKLLPRPSPSSVAAARS